MDKAGLYIHIPFCEQKCVYCDFCSFVRGEAAVTAYVDRLIESAADYKGAYTFDTVFVGGGTPTLLKSGEMTRLVAGIRQHLDIDAVEFTIEGNPNTFTPLKADEYMALGMTRASVGVQSFDDSMLRKLGRVHDGNQARAAISMLKAKGVEVSCDIMIGLEGDSVLRAINDVEIALRLGVDHLSCYGLIVEEGTRLAGDVACGKVVLPSSDAVADIYDAVVARLNDEGLVRYEISNFGKECRHNMGYWQMKPYVGLGLAAHGLITCNSGAISWACEGVVVGNGSCCIDKDKNVVRAGVVVGNGSCEGCEVMQGYTRVYNTSDLDKYLAGEKPTVDEVLTPLDYAIESMILGLRTHLGVDMLRVRETCGEDIYRRVFAVAEDNSQYLDFVGDMIAIKPQYWYCSNAIMEKFMLD